MRNKEPARMYVHSPANRASSKCAKTPCTDHATIYTLHREKGWGGGRIIRMTLTSCAPRDYPLLGSLAGEA